MFGRCFAGSLLLVLQVSFGSCHKHAEEDDTNIQWMVYEREHFHYEDLCEVLNCGKYDVCLVRQNNAMCLSKDKLSEIKGKKVFFGQPESSRRAEKKSYSDLYRSSKKDNLSDDRYRKKVSMYNEKLARKEKEQRGEKSKNEYEKPWRKTKHINNHPAHKTHSVSSRHSTSAKTHCSEASLKQIGGRLLQWFSDVHKVEKSIVTATLPKHKVRCRQDVGWMFQQLDGNLDGELTVEELYTLEHDQYEPCIKPFLDRCDVDADDTISLDEWCDCFEWSDKEIKEPPCHKEIRSVDPHVPGIFRPRCDLEGYYRPEQCFKKMCWCVDKWGREFDHSRVHSRADCGQYAEPDSDDEDLAEGSGDFR